MASASSSAADITDPASFLSAAARPSAARPCSPGLDGLDAAAGGQRPPGVTAGDGKVTTAV